jgi:aminopeptidase N
MRLLLTFVLILSLDAVLAQRPIDVQHYQYDLELSDLSDVIVGKATIKIKFLKPSSVAEFDLVSLKEETGMKVFQVKETGESLPFVHRNDVLEIRLKKPATANETRVYEIDYMGQPGDGLIISENMYGDRTFFADNWPNRARNWIVCNDDPSDKATVEFIVKAPSHYRVISNGLLQDEKMINASTRQTRWKEDIAIPTKVMVIGAARFSVARVDKSFRVPVTAWVYPQDSLKGVKDYALAEPILKFFEELVGPYPYKKLANVQSKTIFGGMENANAIFYAENTVTGTGSAEALIAHEIAHQWFGNTVTEKNFSHLWISEGFATYLTNMFIEHKYGRDSFSKRLAEERAEVIAFSRRSQQPVVDSVSEYMALLNANSYQKGGWVLHMLRQEVGDENFKKILQAFYQQYKFSNADTRDLQAVAEKISGKELKWFFDQWLYRPGVPELEIKVKQDEDGFKIKITQGKVLYKLPLEIEIIKDNQSVKETIVVEGKEMEYKVKAKGSRVKLDPGMQLLFIEK